MGGGNIAPLAENRPLSVKKIRIFKNEPSENARVNSISHENYENVILPLLGPMFSMIK